MKKKSSFRRHASGNIRKKGDKDRLAAELAPLEEQDKSAAEHQVGSDLDSIKDPADADYGGIVVDNDDLKVPVGIAEARNETRLLGIEPVVLVVLIIMLSFIAFITWQIWLMPPS